jgi:hypothetical protein
VASIAGRRFKFALLGYSRSEVDAAIVASEATIAEQASAITAEKARADGAEARAAEMDALADHLAGVVVEREREAERLRAELREAGAGAFEGTIHLDVGPLADFATLAGLEDTLGSIEGVESVAIKRFSANRATMAVRLAEAVELLAKLQEASDLALSVRKASKRHLVLDVAAPGAAAA